MENNNKETEKKAEEEVIEEENPIKRTQYTKQQSFLYTVISVVLFFIIYFAAKGITGTVNRPYQMLVYGEDINAESVAEAFSISGISSENGCVFENARVEKGTDGYAFSALFLVNIEPDAEDDESIAKEIISFEYGDPEEDIRAEFYPYAENPYYAEYAYGEKYVDIETPSREISIFQWDGEVYALYRQYGSVVPSEIKALFSGTEKVY